MSDGCDPENGDLVESAPPVEVPDEVAILRIAAVAHPPISRSMSSATSAAWSRMSGTAMISQ